MGSETLALSLLAAEMQWFYGLSCCPAVNSTGEILRGGFGRGIGSEIALTRGMKTTLVSSGAAGCVK